MQSKPTHRSFWSCSGFGNQLSVVREPVGHLLQHTLHSKGSHAIVWSVVQHMHSSMSDLVHIPQGCFLREDTLLQYHTVRHTGFHGGNLHLVGLV